MNMLTPMISDLVSNKHAYRQLLKVMDFKNLVVDLEDCYNKNFLCWKNRKDKISPKKITRYFQRHKKIWVISF